MQSISALDYITIVYYSIITVQVALFALGIDPADFEDLIAKNQNSQEKRSDRPARQISEAEFIMRMRLLLSRGDPIDEVLKAFDYFHKDDCGEIKKITLMKLKKVAEEFHIRLNGQELQEMIG